MLPPWTFVALDLLEPVTVSAICNKRFYMKVWPLVVTCFATRAVQLLVMHDYNTQAFLLNILVTTVPTSELKQTLA